MAAPIRYKTSAADASAMAKVFYQLAGVTNPTPKALSWWSKQIQQDGSQPAYDNFKTGVGQDKEATRSPRNKGIQDDEGLSLRSNKHKFVLYNMLHK